jgi:hypothetical protein
MKSWGTELALGQGLHGAQRSTVDHGYQGQTPTYPVPCVASVCMRSWAEWDSQEVGPLSGEGWRENVTSPEKLGLE